MTLSPAKLFRYALAGLVPGGTRRCVICEHRVWRFMAYRTGSRGTPTLMRVLHAIGSDPDQFECPRCGSHDRERHLLMYLRASGVMEQFRNSAILHFAPERRLSRLIADAGPASHVQADLFPSAQGVQRVDMLDMPFEDASFDCVIANHVLEHVSDIKRALGEIRRVLRQGGLAVLQTPYSAKLHHTWEDPGIDTAEARLHAYGQEDHVRLFGRDVFERIEEAGFESQVRTHAQLLPDVNPYRTGVNALEPFFLFRKIN